jgi:hypothetical protein
MWVTDVDNNLINLKRCDRILIRTSDSGTMVVEAKKIGGDPVKIFESSDHGDAENVFNEIAGQLETKNVTANGLSDVYLR